MIHELAMGSAASKLRKSLVWLHDFVAFMDNYLRADIEIEKMWSSERN